MSAVSVTQQNGRNVTLRLLPSIPVAERDSDGPHGESEPVPNGWIRILPPAPTSCHQRDTPADGIGFLHNSGVHIVVAAAGTTPYPSSRKGRNPSVRGAPGSWRIDRSVPSRFSARSRGTSVKSYGVV